MTFLTTTRRRTLRLLISPINSMQADLARVRAGKTGSLLRTKDLDSSSDEIRELVLGDSLSKSLDFYSMLATACEKDVITLRIPETLLGTDNGEAVFLYSDAQGVVRSLRGDRTAESFTASAREKYRKLKNWNALGIRFPKFVTFVAGAAQYTLMKTSDLRRYLADGFERAQRYLLPENSVVQKKVVQWQRTKETKVFTATSRVALKGKKTGSPLPGFISPKSVKPDFLHSFSSAFPGKDHPLFSLDLAYIASLRNSKTCDVLKDSRIGEEAEIVLETVKGIVETYLLSPTERLEELILSLMRTQDGQLFLLNCPRIRIRTLDEDSPLDLIRRPLKLTISELASRIEGLDVAERVKSNPLPDLNLEGLLDGQLVQQTESATEDPQRHKRTASHQFICSHLQEVADKFDRLMQHSKALKSASGLKPAISLANYPADFLPSLTRRVSEAVSKEERLLVFFPSRERIERQVEAATKMLFQQSASKSLVRRIHKALNITNEDFEVYTELLAEALRAEKAKQEDIAQCRAFFEDFRSSIVAKSPSDSVPRS